MIDLSSASSAILVNVHRASLHAGNGRRWQADFVFYRLTVIGQLEFRVIYAVELPKHSDKIGLAAKQLTGHDTCAVAQRLPAQMLAGKDALRLDKFLVKLRKWQPGW